MIKICAFLIYALTYQARLIACLDQTHKIKENEIYQELGDEFYLLTDLLTGYKKDIRPTKNHSDVVTVTLGMSLAQIISLDEKNQILTTNCWLSQTWIDNKLAWNPAEYGNVTTVLIPMAQIWKPDILLYNNADSEYYHKMITTNGIVQFNGNVTWLANSIIRSTCAIDVRYFPFDRQNCSMKFASWTYDGYQVDLVVVTEEGDISNYVPSGEWNLVNLTAKRSIVFYSCCAEPYPDITVNIHIQRRPLFYVFNYLMPCGCITLFAFLGFFAPGESGEKVTVGITTLLSLTLFLLMVGEVMPPTATSLPLIALYYGISMMFIGLATSAQVWTLNIHYRGTRGQKVPGWLKKLVFGCMARTLFIQIERVNQPETSANHREKQKLITKNVPDTRCTSGKNRPGQIEPEKERQRKQLLRGFAHRLLSTLDHVCCMIDENERRIFQQLWVDHNSLEWRNLAYIFDKFLFVLFVITTLTVTLVMFFNVPYLITFE